MKLWYISLHLSSRGRDTFEKQFGSQFDSQFEYNVRFICNYLSKAVRKLKIETASYTMLAIELHPTTDGICVSEVHKSLTVRLRYTLDDYYTLRGLKDLNSRYEYYLSLLQRGYEMAVAGGHEEICIVKLLHLHEQFRSLGYKNEWLWKKKLLKDKGLYVFFKCYFTSFDFRLELEAYDIRRIHMFTKGVVWQTLPDELHFDKDFKHLLYNQENIVILDFLEYPIFEIDLPKLCQGECNVTYLQDDLEQRYRRYVEKISIITW